MIRIIIHDSYNFKIFKQLPIPIRELVTAELQEEYPISSETLLSQLCFTHFIELITDVSQLKMKLIIRG